METNKKAIGYIRVSTEEQTEHGLGAEAQRTAILEFCKSQGYEIIKWVDDLGVSGADDNRPGFSDILYGEPTNPPYEAVVVARSDRVARDINIYFGYRYLLSKKGDGIDLVSAEMDFGKFGAFQSVLETFLATMAQIERDSIRIRTTVGRREKVKQGGFGGGVPPFGYKVENGELVIEPKEAEAVRFMFEAYNNGNSLREISPLLKEAGYKTRRGGAFHFNSISSILRNRRLYEGDYKYGDMDWVEGRQEAIIGKEEFPFAGDENASLVPFGYCYKNDKYQVFEPEAEIVRTMFKMADDGIKAYTISSELAADRKTHRYGKELTYWDIDTLLNKRDRYEGKDLYPAII